MENKKISFDSSQHEAIQRILSNKKRLSFLVGGGGFGKTTTIKEIVSRSIMDGIPDAMIYFSATTGKAAKVLQENIAALQMPNKAMTIHRMLGCKGPTWTHDKNNQLQAEIVFIDESSMLDSLLFARLLYSIDPQAKLIFVGDPSQLNPVGAGCPFNDLINAPQNSHLISELKVCWRQRNGSLIAHAAEQCRAGNKIVWGSQGSHTLGGALIDDLFIHETDETLDERMVDRHKSILNETAELVRPWFDSGADFVVLAPQHSTGVGITEMNVYLQNELNPLKESEDTVKVGGFIFRAGDRVKQTKNDYQLGVYNGYIGTITEMDYSRNGFFVDYNGETVHYETKESMFNLILGYAVSFHSAQGSGYDFGVVIADKSHTHMLNRQMIYVALSRFKKECHIVGQQKTVEDAIKKNTRFARDTYLSELLAR